jgi:chromosome partitioning protein
MTTTVLTPLPPSAKALDVVRQWRIDELVPALVGEHPEEGLIPEQRTALEAVRAGLDFNRDASAMFFVPPGITVPTVPFNGEHLVFVVVNQKGGAGKTTTSLELAAAWVAMGYTVRLIDADPQKAGLSALLRPDYDGIPEGERYSLTEVMFGQQPLDEATYATRVNGLYIVPSGDELTRVEYDPRAGRDGDLRRAIRKSQAPIDITIIDAPPSLGKLAINALIAAQRAVIPLKTSSLDFKGMHALQETIRAVQEDTNPDLAIVASVLTEWNKTWMAADIAARVRRDYPEAIIAPARRAASVAATGDRFLPVRAFEPTATVVADYGQLARLLLPVKGAAA